MAFTANNFYRSVFKVWRVRRMETFRQLMQPKLSDRMLDIGGFPGFWTWTDPAVGSIDTINLNVYDWDPATHPDHRIQTLRGNALDLKFADGSYDIAFSNSVIEHVGSWEDQLRFAAEARRVGRGVWVQTPAYECFFEPHYLAPVIHWLPRSWRSKIVNFTPRILMSRSSEDSLRPMLDEIRLISRREMEELFPDCEIYVERIFGVLPKSYVAFRRK